MSRRLVIIGGGQAAAQAVITLRQNGFDGSLTLIGNEPELPYQRPPLSKKYLAGQFERQRLAIRPESFYRDNGVDLELGTRVTGISPRRRAVTLADHGELGYDGLLLATGSRVRQLTVPGAELAGVHYLRTIADADALAAELRSGRRLLIVGAGYIGLEVAAIAVGRGLDVTVLEAAGRVMARTVSAETASFFAALHRASGVRICCDAPVTRMISDERGDARGDERSVVAVETADGRRHDCDVVLAGVGVEPEDTLAREAGLACRDGIVVDECARTAADDVVAAGDCTNHPNGITARRIRLESVHNAIEQAKTAALSLLGRAEPYVQAPWFWSDQYDVKLQIAGLAEPGSERIVRGSVEDRRFAVMHCAGDRLLAVEAVNSPREYLAGRALINSRARVTAAALGDTGIDLLALSKRSG